jgi:hypothetical protein
MEAITPEERQALTDTYRARLWAMQEALLKETVAPLLGRRIPTVLRLQSHGRFQDFTVEIVVDGARMGEDDELILEGYYNHPIHGLPVDAEVRSF